MSEKYNIHCKFWLTLGSLVSLIFSFILVISLSTNNYFENRFYTLLFVPILIYQIGQFIDNYANLTEL